MRPVMAARPISPVLCCALGSVDTMVAEANRQGNGWRSGGLLPLCRLAPLGQVKKGQMRHLGCVRVVDHGDDHLVLRGPWARRQGPPHGESWARALRHTRPSSKLRSSSQRPQPRTLL